MPSQSPLAQRLPVNLTDLWICVSARCNVMEVQLPSVSIQILCSTCPSLSGSFHPLGAQNTENTHTSMHHSDLYSVWPGLCSVHPGLCSMRPSSVLFTQSSAVWYSSQMPSQSPLSQSNPQSITWAPASQSDRFVDLCVSVRCKVMKFNYPVYLYKYDALSMETDIFSKSFGNIPQIPSQIPHDVGAMGSGVVGM